ncbi:MerR family DNA-binding protein [Streptomyces sp. A3M-1-3]|uniref:MerR family DNA-binding protein n=1 Tax=Streptomyces sp. A3M-1-3 TaxID=2962044 RepID=UPI0035AC0BFD
MTCCARTGGKQRAEARLRSCFSASLLFGARWRYRRSPRLRRLSVPAARVVRAAVDGLTLLDAALLPTARSGLSPPRRTTLWWRARTRCHRKRDDGAASCEHVTALIDQHLADIDRRQGELRVTRAALRVVASPAAPRRSGRLRRRRHLPHPHQGE